MNTLATIHGNFQNNSFRLFMLFWFYFSYIQICRYTGLNKKFRKDLHLYMINAKNGFQMGYVLINFLVMFRITYYEKNSFCNMILIVLKVFHNIYIMHGFFFSLL